MKYASYEQDLKQGVSGAVLARRLSDAADGCLLQLSQASLASWQNDLVVLAVGGYGRQQLVPASDWDLLCVLRDEPGPELTADLEQWVQSLYDAGEHPGYRVLPLIELDDRLQEDHHLMTALQERRYLYGHAALYDAVERCFQQLWQQPCIRADFAHQKLDEFRQRRQHSGHTASHMEPDLKLGAGGLRDVCTIRWLKHAVGDAVPVLNRDMQQALKQTESLLLRWRFACNRVARAGKPDVLLFERQHALVGWLGVDCPAGQQPVEAMMREVFRALSKVAVFSDWFVQAVQQHDLPFRESPSGSPLLNNRGDRLALAPVVILDAKAVMMCFVQSQQAGLPLSAETLFALRRHCARLPDDVTQRQSCYPLFLRILRADTQVAALLRVMHQCGLLGWLVPDMARVTGLGQFDRYHAYAVDEHTLHVLEVGSRLREQPPADSFYPLAAEQTQKLARPERFYLALLFHDIAKGCGGDHAVLGAALVGEFCHMLGLSDIDAATVAWCVEAHLLMDRTVQHADLDDSAVIAEFCTQVGSKEKLDLLFCLTVADISGVSPVTWTSWKSHLLGQLYHASVAFLQAGEEGPMPEKMRRLQTLRESSLAGTEKQWAMPYWEMMPASCLNAYDEQRLLWLASLLQASDQGVRLENDAEQDATWLWAWGKDRPSMMADLLSAIALPFVRIVSASLVPLRKGGFIDVFQMVTKSDHAVTEASDQGRLEQRVRQVLQNNWERPVISSSGTRDAVTDGVHQSVHYRPHASRRSTAIQVTAVDRPGLLLEVASALHDLQVNLRGAQISTFGDKAVDTFFIRDADNLPLSVNAAEHLAEHLQQILWQN